MCIQVCGNSLANNPILYGCGGQVSTYFWPYSVFDLRVPKFYMTGQIALGKASKGRSTASYHWKTHSSDPLT